MWYIDTTVAEYNRCKSAWLVCGHRGQGRSDGERTWVVTRGRVARCDGNQIGPCEMREHMALYGAMHNIRDDGQVFATQRRAAARSVPGYGVVVMNDRKEETPAIVSRALASFPDRIG